MKHWLGRTPRTVGDWLGLALGTALIFGGVAQLPALAAALGRLAVILRPFLWGLVLAYVLDIPTRWLAAKWFGGRRGAGAAVSYALLFGAAGLLLWLILPQLAQSVTSLFGKPGRLRGNTAPPAGLGTGHLWRGYRHDGRDFAAADRPAAKRVRGVVGPGQRRLQPKQPPTRPGRRPMRALRWLPASTCCWARKSCCTASAFACGPPYRPGRWDSWVRCFSWRTELLVGTSAGSWWTHCWWEPRPLP